MKRDNQLQSKKRWWDLVTVLLLGIGFSIAFNRLIVTRWTENLDIVRTITYLGLISGLALGYSRFSRRLSFVFGFVYGTYFVIWRLGLSIGSQVPWGDRLYSIWMRLLVIFNHIYQRKPVPDNLLFLILMCILFWVLSCHAGYTLTRHAEPWKIIIPTGVAMVVIHSYDPYFKYRIWFLVVYLLMGLLIVARLNFIHKKDTWIQSQTHLPPHISTDIMRITAAAVAILLLIAWVIPARAASVQSAAEAWAMIKRPFQGIRDSFDNAFASLKSSVGIVSDYYGTSLILGRGNRLSDNELFSVLTPLNPPQGVRYYWRARVYDHYEDGKWLNTMDTNVSIDPATPDINYPKYSQRPPGLYSFFFTTDKPITTLYTAPQPQWVSIPTKAELAIAPDGTADISALRSNSLLQAGDSYYVRSSLSATTVKDMRAAGTDYPTWITERYLQLPESVTVRTIEFAAYLTDGMDNPYDKVMAITNYLRDNVEYQETVPQLPNDREPIDWFLFAYRKGFCNYYATAEVVLLRSIGIPARLAVGFAQGEYQEVTNGYDVREKDAHAWPEVYFPNVGWVEFEPTSAQPVINRPSGDSNSLDPIVPLNSPTNENNLDELSKIRDPRTLGDIPADVVQRNRNLIFTFSLSSVILILGTLLVLRRRHFDMSLPTFPVMVEKSVRRLGVKPPRFLEKWSLHSTLTLIEKAYQEINSALGRLGNQPAPGLTPRERSEKLSALIPEASPPGERLVREYEQASYGLNPPDAEEAKKAASEIKSLSLRKVIQNILSGSKRF